MFKLKKSSYRNFTSIDFSLAILSGLLLGFSYPPFHLYLLAFFAFLPLFVLLREKETLNEINKLVYLFAFVFNLITLYWVGSWTKEADPFLKISGVVLIFFNPLLFLIPSTFFYFIRKKLNENFAFFAFPFGWIFYEFIYSITEFRFPWLTLGNSQAYFSSFIQVAEFIGVYGITLLVLLINILLFFSLKYLLIKNHKKAILFFLSGIILFLIVVLFGIKKESENYFGDEIKIAAIQPNFNPWDKWETGNVTEQLNVYLRLSRKAIDQKADLLIYPETALPVYLTLFSYRKELNRIYDFVDSIDVPLITGMPDMNIYYADAPDDAKNFKKSKRKYTTYNAVYLFNPHTKKIREYHKTLLVPFGEKVPYVEYIPFIGDLLKWEVGISSWNVGGGPKILTANINGNKVKVGSAICIESIYPEYISKFVKSGAEFLAIVTNDSWYGKSSGPYQHEAIAILRSVENRRYVVRAANGGISCIISPKGKIISETKLFTRTILLGKIKLLDEKTFYTNHPYFIPYLSIFITAILFLISLFRRENKHFQKER